MLKEAPGKKRSRLPEPRGGLKPTRIKEPVVDRWFMAGVYILLTTFLLVVLLPLVYIVASSFSDPLAVSSGRVTFWPIDFTLEGYQRALSDSSILTGFGNSLFYTIAGTAISLVLTVAIAYPLSRQDFWGRRGITVFVVFTMLFAGGIIPMYLVVQNLGLLDTRWAIILPQAIGVWQVIIAVAFFRSSIPDELYEAAQLDGASDLRFLFSTVLPLSKPLLAVIALMYAIFQWNSYFDALLYLRNPDLFPLQLVLRNVLILNQAAPGLDAAAAMERQQLADLMKYSLIVISTVPVMLVYPFVARFFNKGILIGAVKG
ncbi:MAG: carbohydrate ABC transporter permease [Microbacterium sp.]|uniref:Aldouronate transport system permease protein n=1 Tax=Microbacterium natoriense TaxID=284570 RepID=A0AAW8EXK4_9MICO|nr:carbohydrate ABC transporter permease [Microbacterium sp.]MBW8762016.1 carbohydrate ABC transporter permease [Microbacterium sp.]MDQ0647102.1 putative aldouronate transport system permease protein [Microbacterium natoriense]